MALTRNSKCGISMSEEPESAFGNLWLCGLVLVIIGAICVGKAVASSCHCCLRRLRAITSRPLEQQEPYEAEELVRAASLRLRRARGHRSLTRPSDEDSGSTESETGESTRDDERSRDKGTELVADGMTKPLAGQSFTGFIHDLGLKKGEIQVKSLVLGQGVPQQPEHSAAQSMEPLTMPQAKISNVHPPQFHFFVFAIVPIDPKSWDDVFQRCVVLATGRKTLHSGAGILCLCAVRFHEMPFIM